MSMAATVAPGAETPASQKNDTRFSELVSTAKKLGENKAKGEDALPMLAHQVVTASYEGVINDKDKIKSKIKDDNGKSEMVSHIHYIFEQYTEGVGKSKQARSAGSIKAQVSKLNAFFKLGRLPKVDGPEVLQRSFELYLKHNPKTKREDCLGIYEYYIVVARAQCHEDNVDAALSDKQLEDLMFKGEKKPKTLEGELKRALNILETLVSGEGDEGIKDTHKFTEDAMNLLRDRLEVIAKAAMVDRLRAECLAAGIKLA